MLYKIMQGLVEVPLPTSFQQATTRTCHGQYQSLVIWLDLDNIFSINNVYFDNMVSKIYPSELQLNKANTSDTEAAFLDLHLSISNLFLPKFMTNVTVVMDVTMGTGPFLA